MGKNKVDAFLLPPQIIAAIRPDSYIYCKLVRSANNPLDTYTGDIILHGIDLHVIHDYEPTVNKDPGTGWIKYT